MNNLVIFAVVYCVLGSSMFLIALNLLGGIKEYKEEIRKENPGMNPIILLFLGTVIFTIAWPYYLFVSFLDRKKGNKDE